MYNFLSHISVRGAQIRVEITYGRGSDQFEAMLDWMRMFRHMNYFLDSRLPPANERG